MSEASTAKAGYTLLKRHVLNVDNNTEVVMNNSAPLGVEHKGKFTSSGDWLDELLQIPERPTIPDAGDPPGPKEESIGGFSDRCKLKCALKMQEPGQTIKS